MRSISRADYHFVFAVMCVSYIDSVFACTHPCQPKGSCKSQSCRLRPQSNTSLKTVEPTMAQPFNTKTRRITYTMRIFVLSCCVRCATWWAKYRTINVEPADTSRDEICSTFQHFIYGYDAFRQSKQLTHTTHVVTFFRSLTRFVYSFSFNSPSRVIHTEDVPALLSILWCFFFLLPLPKLVPLLIFTVIVCS